MAVAVAVAAAAAAAEGLAGRPCHDAEACCPQATGLHHSAEKNKKPCRACPGRASLV